MTPKTITMLALRLFAVYILFELVSSIALTLSALLKPEYRSFDMLEYQLMQVLLYVIAIIVLYTYSEKIADKITKVMPTEKVDTNKTSVEILAALIIAISVFTIISTVPWVVNQLHAFLTTLHSGYTETLGEKQRFNGIIFGLLGVFLQIIVSIVLIFKARSVAIYFEKIQNKQAA
jgi:hypothetical protein